MRKDLSIDTNSLIVVSNFLHSTVQCTVVTLSNYVLYVLPTLW